MGFFDLFRRKPPAPGGAAAKRPEDMSYDELIEKIVLLSLRENRG